MDDNGRESHHEPEPNLRRRHSRTRTSGRRVGKAVGILVVLALFGALAYVIWNRLDDDDYQGDLATFCARLEGSQTDEVSYYARLVAVAPRDIRSAVKRLQDASRDIQELKTGDDLEAYFRAAFDPEQETAENDLENFAEEECRSEDICDTARSAVFC